MRAWRRSLSRVDRLTLSGESHPVRKTSEAVLQTGLPRSEIHDLILTGTTAAAGTGKAVFYAIGMDGLFDPRGDVHGRHDDPPEAAERADSLVKEKVDPRAATAGQAIRGQNSLFHPKPIAHTGFGNEIARAGGIGFELVAKLTHVDAQIMAFINVIRPPHIV